MNSINLKYSLSGKKFSKWKDHQSINTKPLPNRANGISAILVRANKTWFLKALSEWQKDLSNLCRGTLVLKRKFPYLGSHESDLMPQKISWKNNMKSQRGFDPGKKQQRNVLCVAATAKVSEVNFKLVSVLLNYIE